MTIKKIHSEIFSLLYKYSKRDENFFFRLREINRDSKLEQGYWFLGDSESLSISFWSGIDWATQSPIVSFIVYKNGTTKVEVNDHEDLLKEQGIRDIIFETLKLNYTLPKYGHTKRDKYGTNYINSLEDFINDEKKEIDRILQNNVNHLNFNNELNFIEREYFDKSLGRVLSYQSNGKQDLYLGLTKIKISSNIFSNSIEVSNIPKDCKWIFITGENGSGKTNLLKLIASGICSNRDEDNNLLIKADFSIKLTVNNTFTIDYDFVTDELSGRKHFEENKINFCSYGPIRLINETIISEHFKENNFSKKAKSRTYGLFNSISVLQDFSHKNIFGNDKNRNSITIYDRSFLENLIANLTHIIPNIGKVELIEENEGFKLLYYQRKRNEKQLIGPLTFDSLSSGTKNFVGLILDLLIKLETQQKHVDDLANYNGIVIIDEIDLHLHPKMQREIIIQLSKTFPNIQFIVSTHSAISLLGAPENAVFLRTFVDENEKSSCEKLDINVTNLLPNTILSSPIFGLQDLIPVDNELKRLETSDHYNEVIFNEILTKRIKKRLEEGNNL